MPAVPLRPRQNCWTAFLIWEVAARSDLPRNTADRDVYLLDKQLINRCGVIGLRERSFGCLTFHLHPFLDYLARLPIGLAKGRFGETRRPF